MRCVEWGELLPLYVGGELDENLSSEVKLHVGSCADCAAELKILQQAWNSFTASPMPDVRSDFVAAVLDTVKPTSHLLQKGEKNTPNGGWTRRGMRGYNTSSLILLN